MTTGPEASSAGPERDAEGGGRSLLDRLRGTGVGVEDPNIVGDASPTDVAPGADPPPVPGIGPSETAP